MNPIGPGLGRVRERTIDQDTTGKSDREKETLRIFRGGEFFLFFRELISSAKRAILNLLGGTSICQFDVGEFEMPGCWRCAESGALSGLTVYRPQECV
jgi:hypothetical protein